MNQQDHNEKAIKDRFNYAFWYVCGANDTRDPEIKYVDPEHFAVWDRTNNTAPFFIGKNGTVTSHLPSIQDAWKAFTCQPFGCNPGDNIGIADMDAPITWPLYSLVDNGGGCIEMTYICAEHLADPVARLRCLDVALDKRWDDPNGGWTVSTVFTGIDATPSHGSLSGPTFNIGPMGEMVSCNDCWI